MRVGILIAAMLAMACEPPTPEPEDTGPKEVGPPVNEGVEIQSGASKAEICADDCLLLTRYDVHTLKHRFQQLCCEADGNPSDPRCTTTPPATDTDAAVPAPWPFPKTTRCAEWKRLEMCVYAKHGYEFKDDSPFKAYFEEQPWYRPNPSFASSSMTIMTKRNTQAMGAFAKEGVDCVQ